MKCGLLPICQEALVIGPVSYHDYQAVTDEDEQRQAIAQDLGPTNKVSLATFSSVLFRVHAFLTQNSMGITLF